MEGIVRSLTDITKCYRAKEKVILEQKQEAINLLDREESTKKEARKFDVDASTVDLGESTEKRFSLFMKN